MVSPPADVHELMARARAIAGLSLAEVAARRGQSVPADLRRAKGWAGRLVEDCLGASAGSLAEPDFQALGVELKTIPVDRRGNPRESTYVCIVPLTENCGYAWEESWVRRKLARVLWMPLESEPGVPLPQRRLGSALLWELESDLETVLRQDWEELMDLVCLGGLARLSARLGTYLQIRPKAADSHVLAPAIGEGGQRILTNPRGFYLRTAFTREVLRRHYAM